MAIATSLMCGIAPSLHFMILFRILQGLSGGVMQPLSQAAFAAVSVHQLDFCRPSIAA